MTAHTAPEDPSTQPLVPTPPVAPPLAPSQGLLQGLKSFCSRYLERGLALALPPRIAAGVAASGPGPTVRLSPAAGHGSPGPQDELGPAVIVSADQMAFPVAVLRELSTEMLAESGITAAQRRSLSHIRDCGESLHLLVRHLADLALPASENLRLSLSTVRLRELLWQVVGLLRPLAHHKDLDVQLQISPGVPIEVLTDEARLRQVLLCLMSTAVARATQGPVKLTVRRTDDLLQAGPSAARLVFGVHDQGMPPDEGSGSSHAGGEVLDVLHSCRRVVSALGGQLLVEPGPHAPRLSLELELPMPWVEHAA